MQVTTVSGRVVCTGAVRLEGRILVQRQVDLADQALQIGRVHGTGINLV